VHPLEALLFGIVGLCVVVVSSCEQYLFYLHIQVIYTLVAWLVTLLVQFVYLVSSLLYHLVSF
jgi:hypothetical protein